MILAALIILFQQPAAPHGLNVSSNGVARVEITPDGSGLIVHASPADNKFALNTQQSFEITVWLIRDMAPNFAAPLSVPFLREVTNNGGWAQGQSLGCGGTPDAKISVAQGKFVSIATNLVDVVSRGC